MSAVSRSFRRAYATGAHSRPTNYLQLPSLQHVNTSFPDIPNIPYNSDNRAYVPSPVTIKTLAPLIPATAASPRGLANALLRHVAAKNWKEYSKPVERRYGSQKAAEHQWTVFDRMLGKQDEVVNGHHKFAYYRDLIGNVVEANGTMTKKDKAKIRNVIAPSAEKMSIQALRPPKPNAQIADKKAEIADKKTEA